MNGESWGNDLSAWDRTIQVGEQTMKVEHESPETKRINDAIYARGREDERRDVVAWLRTRARAWRDVDDRVADVACGWFTKIEHGYHLPKGPSTDIEDQLCRAPGCKACGNGPRLPGFPKLCTRHRDAVERALKENPPGA